MFKLSPPVVSPRDPGSQRWSYTLLFLDVPTFTTSRLPRDPSSQRWNYVGEKCPMNFVWNARLPRSIQESFTCRKSTTWDGQLYFPSKGKRAEDFFALKNPTASAGFEPANLGTKGQHATSRPPKPLMSIFGQLPKYIHCRPNITPFFFLLTAKHCTKILAHVWAFCVNIL